MNNEYYRAGNPNTPVDELRTLANSASAEVRLRLAENAKCPLDLLARLCLDESPEVRAAAGANPVAPPAVIDRVSRDVNPDVRRVIAGESHVPAEIIRRLAQDAELVVRNRAQQTLVGLALEDELNQSGFQKSEGDSGRLGDLIVLSGILTEEEVRDFLALSRERSLPLGRVLAQQRALSQVLIVQLLNTQAALRKGDITAQEAVVQLERFKKASLGQRQTQQLQPLRLAPAAMEAASSLGIRALIDAAPDGVAIFDESGTVIEWNRQAEIIMGYTRRQAIGAPFWQLLNASSDTGTSPFRALFEGSMNGPRLPIELVTKDGRGGKIPIEVAVSRDEGENAPYIAFIRDVSERKKLEERRSAQYTVTKMLVDALSLEHDGADVLRIMCSTTGWETAELFLLDDAGEGIRRIAVYHDQKAGELPRHDYYAKGVGIPGYVWQTRRPAWMDSLNRTDSHTNSSNQTAALGLPIIFQSEFYGVLHMSSKRMRMPEKDSIEMLATCCSQIAQFLQRQRAEKMRQQVMLLQQREDFMTALAHDLKTPLISGERVLELLINGSLGSLHSDQARVLGMLRESNQALLRMVKNLLSVYKYESGAEHVHLESTDMLGLIKSTVDEVRPICDSKNISIEIFSPTWVDALVVDGLEMRRVMSNLLSNAVKFTGEGGFIYVSVDDDPTEKFLEIRVKDTGIGIPLAEQKNVFRRFWQGNQCHRAIGTGLGLHLCWKIIEAHGGKITCQSEEKTGSTFKIQIPRNLRPSTLVAAPSDTASDLVVRPLAQRT